MSENSKHVIFVMLCCDIIKYMDLFFFGRAAACYDQGVEHAPIYDNETDSFI